MNEIRVINGLHRGVSLPLDGDEIIVGSSLETDIALMDPGVGEQHIHIRKNQGLPPGCWEMEVLDKNTKNEKGKKITGKVTVRLNQKINIGGTWLFICEENEPWSTDEIKTKVKVKAINNTETLRNTSFWVKMYCLAAGVLIGIVTLTHAGGEEDPSDQFIKRLKEQQFIEENDLKISETAKTSTPRDKEAELLHKYKKMLKERDLQSVNIEKQDDQWLLTGDLAPYDYEKLARMQVRFQKKYKPDFNIVNNVGKTEQSLPFAIHRVISGPMGHIEADDGHQLYVGNEYKGFKLVGITKDKIMFTGKNTIEITW